jgi:DNA-binding transcriptional MerR regulator
MAREKDKLTIKQERAVCCLLESRTLSEAAKKAGIGERTLYGWLRSPLFVEAYRRARRQIFSQNMTRLQRLSSGAVDLLSDVLTDDNERGSVRVTASKTVLENSLKILEIEDNQERLDRLEKRLNELEENRKSGKTYRRF